MSLTIKIAEDYTKTPGGRYIIEGPFSGEDFREKLLEPKFEEAIKTNDGLLVDLDGGYGYATSFLEESFGGLARKTHDVRVLEIEVKSDEEPAWVDKIREYIENALREG